MSIFSLSSAKSRRTRGGGWIAATKSTIARYARGNVSAQNRRVQLAEERAAEHKRARAIAKEMKDRAVKAKK